MADNQNKNQNPEQKMHDNYAAMGHKGGEATKEKYGNEFYHDIGTKGGNARKEQMSKSDSYTKEGEEGEGNK